MRGYLEINGLRAALGPLALVCIMTLVCTMMVPASATAGWFGEKKQKRERKPPQRFETAPPMSYLSGTLVRSHHGGWKIEGTKLSFDVPDPRQFKQNRQRLSEGQEVVVMGNLLGDLMVVEETIVQTPEWQIFRSTSTDNAIIWSESDPTVGEGRDLPQ